MMFMSTVIYFAELVMMSLIGIMVYKLFLSYENWKTASLFSAQSSSSKASLKARKASSTKLENADRKADAKFTAATLQSDYLATHKIKVELDNTSVLPQESKPSVILNDYIGEFFSEAESVDIEPYKAEGPAIEVSSKPCSDSTAQLVGKISINSEEEFITVESIKQPFIDSSETALNFPEIASPDLKEFSDIESDSFITVAPVNDEEKENLKVMSDKVVLAMLDEAKLVRAS